MEKKYQGLTSGQAENLLKQSGKNILPHKKPVGDLIILADQIKSPLIYILLFAAVVSLVLTDIKDAIIIFAAVLLNTILGFYQERKAQHALYSLKQILNPKTRVLRDNEVVTIDVGNIVPGDVILLAPGDRIAADGYTFHTVNLLVNESVLTGESVPVTKTATQNENNIPKSCQLFMGTTVIAGRGKMIVSKTGKTSEFGKIASELSTTAEEATPLQIKINEFAKFIALVFLGVCFLVFTLGILTGKSFMEMFSTSVALAVASIPEGMAVSLTAILALGMQRILKRKALVRKLMAAEALGSTTIIATDKTGTLTLGVMSVVKTMFSDKSKALEASVFANNREDALEISLWDFAQKNNLDPQNLEKDHKRIKEIPFDSTRKYQAVLVNNSDNIIYVKGAPEVIIHRSRLAKQEKRKWMDKADEWGAQGLRLLAFAYKTTKLKRLTDHDVNSLQFTGLVGITDPVRSSVKDALIKTHKAGIKTKVITGDYATTSIAVLKKLAIAVKGSQILEGEEIEKLSDSQLADRVNGVVLFARVSPSQKLKIVQALQKNGEVVALVGDGVNDAPAIKAANIGIVVAGATDVARQTADMVLLDSNFATIVDSIEEGRGIYQNIKKVIFFLMAGSFSEIVLVLSSLIAGVPLPVIASQILWINIVTDGFPNLALTVDPKQKNLLDYPPISVKTQLFDNLMKFTMALVSISTGILLLGLFIFTLNKTNDLTFARTVVFTSLGITMLLYVFSLRTLKTPIYKSGIFANTYLLIAVIVGLCFQILPIYNPTLRGFLETTIIPLGWWGYILIVPVVIILLLEFVKIAYIIPKNKSSF
ncbi:HAD-IC family P-type ATPase [Candidatus Gottesmanbacteria bacterium]|nr:HAD-IC family P-type ATPase [Candidatus Gottesmanbacteria bacterium]